MDCPAQILAALRTVSPSVARSRLGTLIFSVERRPIKGWAVAGKTHTTMALRLCGGPSSKILPKLRKNYLAGHDASIAAATAAIDLPSPNQAVNWVHSDPAPTAAGIASEASNTKVDFGSDR